MPNQALVMIVDDFKDALSMYGEYLTFRGYRVIVAGSGAEAITLARSTHPAVIFMDLRMSDMTGTEAMHVLREDDEFRDVPIVAFTAHALAHEKEIALSAGFDEVIAKPCNPDELIVAIDRLLSSVAQHPATPGPPSTVATSQPN